MRVSLSPASQTHVLPAPTSNAVTLQFVVKLVFSICIIIMATQILFPTEN